LESDNVADVLANAAIARLYQTGWPDRFVTTLALMRAILILTLALSSLPLVASAASFRTQRGESFEAEISGVYGDILFLRNTRGTATLDLDSLDDASLAHVARFLARPTTPAPWRTSESPLTKSLAKRLQVLRDGKLVPFDPGDRREPEFYLIYFGAHWCGPCRRFSPDLLKAYQQMKAAAPERFEVIFVSDDRDAAEQLTYVRELPMPWPVLRHGAAISALDRWRARGIPCLVVLTRDNQLLFHSYAGEQYLGAHDPLEKFSALLGHLVQNTPSPARHRLAVAAHVLAAAGGDRAAAPYLVAIDPRRNRTLPKTPIQARVRLDAKGLVLNAEFTPALELIAADQLQRETENWRFLPAVKQGQPVATVVEFPVSVGN
jgi:thiol-disulfide isomerase/thioredoxin